MTVRPRAHLVDHRRFEIEKDASRHVFPGASLGEERVKRIILDPGIGVRGHLSTSRAGTRCSFVSQSETVVVVVVVVVVVARIDKIKTKYKKRINHDALRLNSVFETIQFPTRVPRLDPSLPDVNRDHFPHRRRSFVVCVASVVVRALVEGVSASESMSLRRCLPHARACDVDDERIHPTIHPLR